MASGADERAPRSPSWLVEGLMLQHDVRLDRLALAIDGPPKLSARVLPDDRRAEVGAHFDEPDASLLQLGVCQTRRDLLRGRAPKVEVALMVDFDVRGTPGEQGTLKRFHARKGLPYGERWLPPGSFEERNAAWWVPNTIMPRFPKDQPPVLG